MGELATDVRICADIIKLMAHKDDLVNKWLEKWAVMDARLHDSRSEVLAGRVKK